MILSEPVLKRETGDVRIETEEILAGLARIMQWQDVRVPKPGGDFDLSASARCIESRS